MEYATLHDLLAKDARSKALYDQLPPEVQVAMQEQRQNIRCHDDLVKAAEGFQKRSHK